MGVNRITAQQDSCLIREEWQSLESDFSGTSYNYYDADTGQWKQVWIDNKGTHLELKGGLNNNRMVLRSDIIKNEAGENRLNRITWTPLLNGNVRQHWEVSEDGGLEWKTVFDGLYKKRGPG